MAGDDITLSTIDGRLTRLQVITEEGFKHTDRRLDSVDSHLEQLNGKVADHDLGIASNARELAVHRRDLEHLREHQRESQEELKPLVERVTQNRIDIASVVAKWGSIGIGGGTGIGLIWMIGKSQGWW